MNSERIRQRRVSTNRQQETMRGRLGLVRVTVKEVEREREREREREEDMK